MTSGNDATRLRRPRRQPAQRPKEAACPRRKRTCSPYAPSPRKCSATRTSRTRPTGLPTISSSIKCPGTTPDKKGAIDSYRIFFAASPDMTAEIHDMVAAGDKVAIRATYRGTDEGGFIPNMPATGKAFEMEAMYLVRVNDEGQIAEHWGVVDTIGTMGQLGLLPPA